MGGLAAPLAAGLLLLAIAPIDGTPPERLRCPKGVTKFSATGSKTAYYHCENEEATATLKTCHEGRVYNQRRQICTRAGDNSDVLPLEEKTLGRNFVLGAFYDARTNIVFPETSFWSQDVIQNNATVNNRFKVDLDVQSLYRTRERTKFFDVSAYLSVDFMAGSVHVAGTAGFLKEDVTSETEANVAMVYQSTKYSKTINKHTAKSYIDECSQGSKYTHVVTSVEYGLDAVFSFKRQTQAHENDMQVTGSLELSINKIPGTTIEGSGEVNMTEWEKELFNTTTLEVFGDFSPEKQLPTTFEEAVRFYKSMSEMAGTGEEGYPGAQVTRVHLTPYSHMCTDAEVVYNEVSDGMLVRIVEILDELEQMEVKVNGMMNSDLAIMFNPLRKNLGVYKTALRNHTISLKSQLQKILPNVRDTNNAQGEQALTDLIIAHEETPFAFDKSNNFLIDRKRELNAIKYLVETVLDSNVAVADFEKATDVAYVFGKNQLVMLTLNILSDTDNTNSFLNGNPNNEEGFWYNKADVNGHVGSLLQSLRSFSEVMVEEEDYGFMVKLAPFQDEPIVMSALLEGFVESNEFISPPAPPAPTVLEVSPTGFFFKVAKHNEFVTKLNITITDVLESRTFDTTKDVDADIGVGADIDVAIEGLEPAHVYSFHVQYMTALGSGPSSPESSRPFSTRPTSEPQELLETNITRHQINVNWQPPAHIAEAVTSTDLRYRVTVTGTNGFHSVQITDAHTFTLEEPAPDTKFTFEVVSILNRPLEENPDYESPSNFTKISGDMEITWESSSTSLSLFSLPAPPKMSQVVSEEVGKNSATVSWEPNTLAPGAQLVHYVLEYNAMNETGTVDFAGTEKRLIIQKEMGEEITLDELTPGSVYNVRVKVKTTQGESEFSSSLLFMTNFDADDINSARESIMGEINGLSAEVTDHVTYCAWWRNDGSTLFLEDDTCNGGSMDANGVFNAKRAGVYQVTVSLQAKVDPGATINLWVRHNSNNLEESKIQAYNDINSFGYKIDNTGRTIILDLAEGDNVKLFTDSPDANLGILVPFCVSSVKI